MNKHALTLVIVLLSAGCGSNKASVAGDAGIASEGIGVDGTCAVSRLRRAPRWRWRTGAHRAPVEQVRAWPVDPVSYLAYAYGMRLELPGDRLIGVMDGHAAACRNAGLRVCQLVAIEA